MVSFARIVAVEQTLNTTLPRRAIQVAVESNFIAITYGSYLNIHKLWIKEKKLCVSHRFLELSTVYDVPSWP